MMKDVIIKIDQNSMVYKQETVLGISYENLQGKIIFKFLGTFPKGTAYLEYERDTEKGYLQMNQVGEEYQLEIKSSLLTKEGRIYLQLRVTEDATPEGTPVFKSNKFYLEVKEAINATAEIPDEYPEWIDTANEKIKEMDNLNITTERVEDGVDIVLTDKKGVTTRTEVKDGAPGPVGPQGAPGAVKMQVVDTLPETGETDTIYLVKKDNPGEQNLYDEYVYTDTGWEHIGDTSVDLSDYYTKEEIGALTDLSTEDKSSIVNAINEVANSNDGNLLTLNISITAGSNIYSGEPIEKCSELINNLYKIGEKNVCILFYNQIYTNTFRKNCLMSLYQDASQQRTLYEFTGLVNGTGNGYDTIIQGMKLTIAGTWDNNIFTANRVSLINDNETISMYNINNKFLSKTNTTSYTPTADYNPATKKYVDDLTGLPELIDQAIDLTSIETGTYIIGGKNTTIKTGLSFTHRRIFANDDSRAILITCKVNNDGFGTGILIMGDFKSGVYGNKRSRIILYNYDGYDVLDATNILFKNNTITYTPTSDYHPATKKYVDDQVGNINTVLATLTTVSEVTK